MKRFFALLLSAMLLLSSCAFAEETAATTGYKLSGIMYMTADQDANVELVDLSRLSVEFDISEDGDTGCVHVDVDGESVAEFGLTLKDELIVLHLESATVGHQDYTIDPVAALARVMKQGADIVVELLNSLDTTALAHQMIFGSDTAEEVPAEEAPAEEPAVEADDGTIEIEIDLSEGLNMNLPDLGIDGDFISVLMECIDGPKTVTMGGDSYDSEGNVTEIAEAEYQETVISMDMDHICRLLNMVTVDGEPAGLGDLLRETGVEFSIDASVDLGENNSMGGLVIAVVSGEDKSDYQVSFEQHTSDAGTILTMNMSATDQGATAAYSFTLSSGTHEGEAFSPDEVDLSTAIALGDLADADANAKLTEALTNLATDASGALTDVLLDAMGVDLDALTESVEEAPVEE